MDWDLIVIGGGAAGFFGALTLAEQVEGARILILEGGKEVLGKVRISGGGRCNVTHACPDAKELVRNYPRGQKALLGPFHKFGTEDTINWFEWHGVELKTESDGRMFPTTDDSQTIVDCLLDTAKANGVQYKLGERVRTFRPLEGEGGFELETNTGSKYSCKLLLLTPGSSQPMWKHLAALGHRIVPPVPSLFTFNIKDERITPLPGISVSMASVEVPEAKLRDEGPLLITHWGMSGPAILRLSAWGARKLKDLNYDFRLRVNWVGRKSGDAVREQLNAAKRSLGGRQVLTSPQFGLPKRLWQRICDAALIFGEMRWADLNRGQLEGLCAEISQAEFQVKGKSTFKEEFVTAGGVHLDEIDFRSFQSRIIPGLFMAGEVLNIDAVTGGFNFQAAWTGAYLAGTAMAQVLKP